MYFEASGVTIVVPSVGRLSITTAVPSIGVQA